MTRLFYTAVLFLATSISGITQQKTPPAFVMLEDVFVSADDPRFAPLFDTLSSNGKGSFIFDLFEPFLSGNSDAVADMEGTIHVTVDELKNILFQKPFFEENWSPGDEPDMNEFAVDKQQSLKDILAFRLYFVSCFDSNMKLISRSFVGLIPMKSLRDRNNEFRGWKRTLYLSAKNAGVQNVLSKNCTAAAFQKTSYLSFLNQIPVDELAHEAHYISLKKAASISDNFPYELSSTSFSGSPLTIASNAKLIEKTARIDINYLLNPIMFNNFFKLGNGPEKIQLNYGIDCSAFPMFFGDEMYGFLSIAQTVYTSISKGNNVYAAGEGGVFDERISSDDVKSKLWVCDTIEVYDTIT